MDSIKVGTKLRNKFTLEVLKVVSIYSKTFGNVTMNYAELSDGTPIVISEFNKCWEIYGK